MWPETIGDFVSEGAKSGAWTSCQFAKARHWWAFLGFMRVESLSAALLGWLGRGDSNPKMVNWNLRVRGRQV
jgi:hypothetical protein